MFFMGSDASLLVGPVFLVFLSATLLSQGNMAMQLQYKKTYMI